MTHQLSCHNSNKLIRESSNRQFLKYNNNLIDEISDEITKDYEKFCEIVNKTKENTEKHTEKQSESIVKYVLYDKAERNKRAIMIYLNERLKKLKSYAWIFQNTPPSHVKSNFEDNDFLFYSQYIKNMEKYFKSLSPIISIDLSKQTKPPKNSVYVSVLANENIKNFKINNESESITIEKGSSYLFPRVDIDLYILRGSFSYNE